MISLLKVYRVNGLSGRTGALSSVYPLVDCRASARENKWTRLKKTLRIIRHDNNSPSFSSRNVNNVNFYLQLDRNSANWLPIHHTEYTITDSKSFVQRGGIFPRCLHRGKFRFFNLGYVHERLCRKTYRPLWWRHLSRKWGTKPPSCTQESAISRRRRRTSALSRFIRRSIKYLSAPHAPSPLPPEIRVVFHVRGFDRFPINENAILNTVKRTANATICAAR